MAKKKAAASRRSAKKGTKKASGARSARRSGDQALQQALNSVPVSLWHEARQSVDTELPEGTYVVKLVSAKVGHKNGIPWFRVQAVVSRGEFRGAQISDFWRFNTEVGARILLANLKGLGIELDGLTPDYLPLVAEQLSTQDSPEFRARVKVTGDFTNLYIDGEVLQD